MLAHELLYRWIKVHNVKTKCRVLNSNTRNRMFLQAGAHRFVTQQGRVRCCNRMMYSYTMDKRLRNSVTTSNASMSRKNHTAVLAQLSNTLLRIQHQIVNDKIYNQQPIVIPSRNHMNVASSTSTACSSTNSSTVCNSTSVILSLDLECGTIDGDDDG